MNKILLWIGIFLSIFGGAFQASAHACLIDLGAADDFALLGLTDADVTIGSEATTINGDVGIGPNNTGDLLKATINGTLFIDPTATPNVHGDLIVIGGSVTQDLTQPVLDALLASAAAAALLPTQTFGDITTSTTITSDQMCNVILLNSLDLVKKTLTLDGNPDDYFIFNVAHGFSLSSSIIQLSGGVTAGHVLFNFPDPGASKSDDIFIFKSQDVTQAYGTFLAPHRNVSLDKAGLYGAILSGGEILVHSGAQLNNVPFQSQSSTPTPEPGSFALISWGLASFWFQRRRQYTPKLLP